MSTEVTIEAKKMETELKHRYNIAVTGFYPTVLALGYNGRRVLGLVLEPGNETFVESLVEERESFEYLVHV